MFVTDITGFLPTIYKKFIKSVKKDTHQKNGLNRQFTEKKTYMINKQEKTHFHKQSGKCKLILS